MRDIRIRLLLLAVLLLGVLGWNTRAGAATVNFSWDASPSLLATGYEMGCGAASGNYTVLLDLKSKALSVAFPNITEGVDTFCNVRAYDANGVRSAWNGEVKVHPQVAAPLNLRVTTIVAINGVEVSRTVKNFTYTPSAIRIGALN